MKDEVKTALIVGAGPGGLTAAFEMLSRTKIKPVIFEKTNEIGGISKTVNFKGNRIDIGGHRFFSKSKRVMDWWKMFLPLEISDMDTDNPKQGFNNEKVMLVRNRLSRIFYLRNFFDYPISLNFETLKKLGLIRVFKIGFAYLRISIFPIKEEKNLEDFFINRFGNELYLTFFKDYTEKVWGIPCKEIKPEWGAQRIKGLNVSKAIYHALSSSFRTKSSIEQTKIETSLIDKFMYPKLGPGQLWETVRDEIVDMGGTVVENSEVISINWLNQDEVELTTFNSISGEKTVHKGNYLFSTMPIKELIKCLGKKAPDNVKRIAEGLPYRDFMTVGLLLNKLKIKNKINGKNSEELISDNWIYIQEKDVAIGRLQIFNNWSPYLVADEKNIWLGLEYFCNEGDALWSMEDNEFIQFAIKELEKIDIIDSREVIDSTLIRVPKAYPAYFGTYEEIDKVVNFTNTFNNMYLIGRNGMHKYNNQDHSMLTAMVSVDHIISGNMDKTTIWSINAEQEYHESSDQK